MKNYKPSKEDLRDATNRTTADLIDYDLKVLFCGINPGLWSGATGLHFAKPGNRFWKVLHLAGFTDRQLHPSEEDELLALGYGITSFVKRTTARADELTAAEFTEGGRLLVKKLEKYRPRHLAVLGIGAYRTAFAEPKAKIGPQEKTLAGARVWVLPNPSGLNANYQLADFVDLFGALRRALESD